MIASRALIVAPGPRGVSTGNQVTALRWKEVLDTIGVRTVVATDYSGQACDLLIALHGAKSAASIEMFQVARPHSPIVLALTGTDLYEDPHVGRDVLRSMTLAHRIVVLQPLAIDRVPCQLRSRTRTILQSVVPVTGVEPRREDRFDVCVLGHLRPVKDPFRTAAAARLLPAESRVHVVHVGAALEPAMADQALSEQATNPRYSWLAELDRDDALRVLARSRLAVSSSAMEGGANAVGEALVHAVPIVASRIAGSVGLLGEDYPAYFPVGDTRALADLLLGLESDPQRLEALRARCRGLAPRFDREHEIEAWRRLMKEL